MFNGSKMETTGKCRKFLLTPNLNEEYKADFTVVSKECTSLLGYKTVQQTKLRKVHYENISTVQKKLKIQKEEALGLTMKQITSKFFTMGSLEKENLTRIFTWN